MWYVYFLELSNGDIYVGFTSDLKHRFASHQRGEVRSTRLYLPAILRAYVAVETEATARELERYFKTGSGKAIAMKRFLRTDRKAAEELAALGGSEPHPRRTPRRRMSRAKV